MRKSGALGLLQDVFWAVQTITTHSKKRVGVCVGDVMAPLHAQRGQLKRVWPTQLEKRTNTASHAHAVFCLAAR